MSLPSTLTGKGSRRAARMSLSEPAQLAVVLRLGSVRLARATRAVTRAGGTTVQLKLTRSTLARLRRSRKRPTLVVTATDAAGNARTAKRLVKLKP